MAAEAKVRPSWKQRPEGGSPAMVRLILAIARGGGRGAARLCLYPIVAYFLCVRAAERRASRAWLSRVQGRPASLWAVARHIHTFSATILDRVFLLGGRMGVFDIDVQGLEHLEALLDQGRGALLFGSHLGSFDALRVLSRRRPGLQVRIVLDRGQNPTLTQIFDSLDPALAAGVIDGAQPGPVIALEIQHALQAGALVALLVDRVHGHEETVAVPFLGHPAQLPLTPWRLAIALHAPVLLCFGLYRGGNRYDLRFEPFLDPLADPPPARAGRAEWLRERVAAYAARLEHHARDAAYNWFNFYDFWNDHDPSDPTGVAAPAPRAAAGVRDGAAGGAGR
ncbi:lipid A biosynthesis acyltransferase [Pseudoxanthomonas suwonensis 11-1]|uniref:Lipid A biosynthesis acyltransferase n=1 Tax=Pseudoxanthomonas suwonensis (strain 11-1) TaxID=743721 RepID=E6WWR9_PSEUU|nr:acyltransferase [Pseudoxanthomonas suwonensis]ADV28618.1 lipid A biosynthesis acyltransferase [Pseudoxanthomonas suwonensis 11-1]